MLILASIICLFTGVICILGQITTIIHDGPTNIFLFYLLGAIVSSSLGLVINKKIVNNLKKIKANKRTSVDELYGRK